MAKQKSIESYQHGDKKRVNNPPAGLVTPRTLDFEFRGNGLEFFRIWIVNLLLTILTLGIYYAWAKTRTNRYFYSNLYLDGVSFRYLASPMTILKGQVIVFIIFVLYALAERTNFEWPAFFLLMGAIPFLVVRATAFGHQVSAYRNIQFRFQGGYGEAAMAVLVWPLLGVLTLGVLLPFVLVRRARFIVNNSTYGTTPMQFHATYRDYVAPVLVSGGIFAAPTVLALAMLGSAWWLVALAAFGCARVYLITRSTNIYYNSTTLGEHRFRAHLEFPGLLRVYAMNTLLTVVTLGLYLPVAKVRLAQYNTEHIAFIAQESIDDFVATEQQHIGALGEEMGEAFDFDIGAV